MQKLFKSWEPQYVKRNTIIQIIIVALTFIVMAGIWPFGQVHNHDWVKQQAFHPKKEQLVGDSFGLEDKKLQTVFFSKEHIYQMRVYLNAFEYDNRDFVYFRLYDETFSCIYSEDFGCNLIARDGYVQPKIDMDVIPGKPYFYEIIVPQKATFWWMYTIRIGVPTAPVSSLGQTENGILYIDGIINDQIAMVADFDYGEPLTWWQIVVFEILVAVFGFLAYVLTMLIVNVMDQCNESFVKKAKLAADMVTVVICMIYFYFIFVEKAFGQSILDQLVFALGGLVAVLMIFYWNHLPKRQSIESVSNAGMISLTWRNAIQIVSFGLLFYALSMYVNADVEYLHTNNTRWMLIFMGIALLAVPAPKIFLKKINAIWFVAALVFAIPYSLAHETGQDRYLAKLTAAVIMVWGFVILQLLLRKRRGFWNRLQKPYFFVWLAFILCTYIYRYEKTWVFTASIPFIAILLYDMKAEEKRRFLRNAAQGILFSFWLMTFYNLHHRPYHYWIYYRYSGLFHTVACTGLYLAVVAGAAFSLILGKWKNKKDVRGIALYEIITLTVASNYIILSMSRTALLAVIMDIVIMMFLSMWVYKKSLLKAIKEGSMLLILVLISFPLVFSAQRILPALVNDPQYHRIEDQNREFAIHQGEATDSSKYMTMERFLSMFTGRVQTGDAGSKLDASVPQENLLVTINPQSLPVVMKAAPDETEEDKTDFSNGRFDIFKLYLSKVSFKGNPGTVLESPSGESIAHAHNSYIMVFYNFGMIGGILFMVLCVWTLVRGILVWKEKGMKAGIYAVPVSLIIVFGVTGLTEWTFHPCFTPGYVFLLMIPLLMQQEEKKSTNR